MSKERVLVLAAVAAALSMSLSMGAAEARDPRDGRGPFFDGDWTPVKVRSHHAAKDAQRQRGIERRPARKRK